MTIIKTIKLVTVATILGKIDRFTCFDTTLPIISFAICNVKDYKFKTSGPGASLKDYPDRAF